MSTRDAVAVVGAGVVGVCCARALQRAGRRVVLIDPAAPGSGCSAGNAGHIATDHVRPLARPDVLGGVPRMLRAPLGPLCIRARGVPAMSPWLARFAAAARPSRVAAGTAALAALLGTALPDWVTELEQAGLSAMLRRDGALSVFETARGVAAAAAEGRVLEAHGVGFRDLSAVEAAERLPGLAVPLSGGRLHPDAAHVVEPHRLVRALFERFAADGGELLSRPVSGFQRDGGRVTAVLTPDGERAVDAAVLTAGLGSAALGRTLGLRLPMTAERGYHAMLEPGALDVPLPTLFSERGFVVTPMEHGTRLAGTVEFGAARRAPDWARADILATHAAQLFGRPVAARERWQGDRPTLPDYLPAIGRAPGLENFVVAAGHQHLGLTLAATTARLVAVLLDGRPPGLDLQPFDPARFGLLGRPRAPARAA